MQLGLACFLCLESRANELVSDIVSALHRIRYRTEFAATFLIASLSGLGFPPGAAPLASPRSSFAIALSCHNFDAAQQILPAITTTSYFGAENDAGSRNWRLTEASRGPVFSVSANMAAHSLSAIKAFHCCSRWTSESHSRRGFSSPANELPATGRSQSRSQPKRRGLRADYRHGKHSIAQQHGKQIDANGRGAEGETERDRQ